MATSNAEQVFEAIKAMSLAEFTSLLDLQEDLEDSADAGEPVHVIDSFDGTQFSIADIKVELVPHP